MEGLLLGHVVVGQQLLLVFLQVDRVLAHLLIEYLASVVCCRLKFTFSLQNSADMKDELFLDGIGVLSDFESGWHQLVLV